MPETYGKRQRGNVKAKKAAAREERRLARNQRKANREAGLPEDWLQEPPPPEGEEDTAPQAQPSDTEEQTQTDEQTQTESTP